jgi:hypothetical protein
MPYFASVVPSVGGVPENQDRSVEVRVNQRFTPPTRVRNQLLRSDIYFRISVYLMALFQLLSGMIIAGEWTGAKEYRLQENYGISTCGS